MTITLAEQASAPLSAKQAYAQLHFVWPRLASGKNREPILKALAQIEADWIEEFRKEHPHAQNATIYRVNKHEIQIRGLHTEKPSVHWVDHPRLVGRGLAWGLYADYVQDLREASCSQR